MGQDGEQFCLVQALEQADRNFDPWPDKPIPACRRLGPPEVGEPLGNTQGFARVHQSRR